MKMKNFSTWLITIFMVMFWAFRTIVAICTQFSINFMGLLAYNLNWEIILAFVTIVCILLVIKRKMIGAWLYILLYGTYFGEHLFTTIFPVMQGKIAFSISVATNLFCDLIAILLAIFVLLDMLVDRSRKTNPIDKRTDWYFKNKKYEDEINARDSREDKNEYKFY